ncbi:hypothetical protein [uncultured Allomuricauda sp.]|uniref:hypothetical protein n=1 Tax=Flagellimonas sp. W118 TaxID=3410791 RepID=UPI002618BC8E|nr:hypothetical protein [uncultured Allomuricauda sp.]
MIPKTFNNFQDTLNSSEPPAAWSLALQSLWWDAKGNWDASHNIAQDMNSTMGNWIHAYLHRKEGDDWNAGYWYRQAGRSFPESTFEEELQELVESAINT